MAIKKPGDIAASQITNPSVYANRRTFMRAGILGATVLTTGWLYRRLNPPRPQHTSAASFAGLPPPTRDAIIRGFRTTEPLTAFEDITHYNNFYEFSTTKESVAYEAAGFIKRPWTLSVVGLCRKPRNFELDDLVKIAPAEQRVYRMRCVEGWSMVIPWNGFSLSKLLDRVEPTSNAKFVSFQTLLDPKRMPNQRSGILSWPYVEGLRMDEAMHPLTILATGLYDNPLPPQDGAPVRLVVPWKYGFKGAKSLVKIELLSRQPATTWNSYASDEYGFYANVNPNVDHPRWSQATERRIGDFGRRDTLMFNGYAEQVGYLYAGMDLRVDF